MLADQEHSFRCRVDILLGGPQLGRCLLSRMKVSSAQNCMALNSIFGWRVTGSPGDYEVNSQSVSCRQLQPILDDPDQLLQWFWEMQELSEEKTVVTADEQHISFETRLVMMMDVIVYACHDVRTLQSWDNHRKML